MRALRASVPRNGRGPTGTTWEANSHAPCTIEESHRNSTISLTEY